MKIITRMLATLVAMGMICLGNPGKADAAYACYKKASDGTTVYTSTLLSCNILKASLARSGNPVGNEDNILKDKGLLLEGLLSTDEMLIVMNAGALPVTQAVFQADFLSLLAGLNFDLIATPVLTNGQMITFTALTASQSTLLNQALSVSNLAAVGEQQAGSQSYNLMMLANNDGPATIPEPSTVMLMAAGLAGFAVIGYKRRRTTRIN
ncbi:MAG: PEP-CTERM sorting domain-containing protein [Verrucomicrobia bacterium]|nr:PEP-CTERM sorting domain-containing protein [Deltaproteobacteria bacterium]